MSARILPLLLVLVAAAREGVGEPQALTTSATATVNSTTSIARNDTEKEHEHENGSRISTILRDLPTIKNIVIFVCVLTMVLITVLVIRVYRSGKKIRKTRKYDIITTPAERVEMAPLNEENDEDDDSTLFDVKYR